MSSNRLADLQDADMAEALAESLDRIQRASECNLGLYKKLKDYEEYGRRFSVTLKRDPESTSVACASSPTPKSRVRTGS